MINSFAFLPKETIRQGLARLDSLISQTEAFYPIDQRVGRRANLKYQILMACLPDDIKVEIRLNELRAAKAGNYYTTDSILIDAEDLMAARKREFYPRSTQPIHLVNALEVNSTYPTKRPRLDENEDKMKGSNPMDYQSNPGNPQKRGYGDRRPKQGNQQNSGKNNERKKNFQQFKQRIQQHQQQKFGNRSQQQQQQQQQQYQQQQQPKQQQNFSRQNYSNTPRQYKNQNYRSNQSGRNYQRQNRNFGRSNNRYNQGRYYNNFNNYNKSRDLPFKAFWGYDPRTNKHVCAHTYDSNVIQPSNKGRKDYNYPRVNTVDVQQNPCCCNAHIKQEQQQEQQVPQTQQLN